MRWLMVLVLGVVGCADYTPTEPCVPEAQVTALVDGAGNVVGQANIAVCVDVEPTGVPWLP